MKIALYAAAALACSVAFSSAQAATHLTPQQCTSYPFVKTAKAPTHAQLDAELKLLESVGYHPNVSDNQYPHQLNLAEARLRAKFRAECMKPSPHKSGANSAVQSVGAPAS
ncbi:DUF4148 domain-containing protein [Paraburkholderia tropica]|uniref:DUF4148 domain-containing protein n=1 Tax=Paraburkholderia tropica TaxID=92647 RepID=UPI002AB2916A|nr:DUF4148 domain-containing protein [Paraburkholderia tropica]